MDNNNSSLSSTSTSSTSSLNNNNNNNYYVGSQQIQSPVEILIDHCRRIQAETDTYIQQVDIVNTYDSGSDHHTHPEFNDVAIETKFNYAIKQYNTCIEIIENILKNDSTLCDRLADFLEYSVVTRNQIIQTKANMLDQQLENTEFETLMSLSRATVYRWRVHHDLLKQTHDYEQCVERETLGVGELHLLRASDLLHILEVCVTCHDPAAMADPSSLPLPATGNQSINRSLDHSISIDTDTVRSIDIRFPLARETPIFMVARGNYVLQLADYYYGLLLPFDIPEVYISLFESKLAGICCFGVLHQHQESTIPPPLGVTSTSCTSTTTTTTTTSTTTTTTTSSSSTEIVALPDSDTLSASSFAVRSLKSMSTSIDNGGQSVTNGIVAASSMISLGLRGGGYYLKSTLAKNSAPTVVSPVVAGTIGYIKSATPYASKGSSYLVSVLSDVVEVVGSGLYNGIKALVPSSDGPSPTLEAATQLGTSSIRAISSISSALSEGLANIVDEATGTTVEVVQHRYGKQVANLTNDTLNISKDVVNTALNLQLGSAKAFAIKALTEGGSKIAAAAHQKTESEDAQETEEQEPALKPVQLSG